MRVAAILLASIVGCQQEPVDQEVHALLRAYGCPACHVVPGMRGPQGVTGPPLTAMDRQAYVAGVAPNTPEALATFIADPQAVNPRSAMPNLGVTVDEARAIAAYLYEAGGGS